jgi:proteasome lid subunit RPN8/RPN11
LKQLGILWLIDAHLDQMIAHARQDAPDEVCGLIAGHLRGEIAQAVHVIPMPNAAADRRHHYAIHPTDLSRELTAFTHAGLELIGIYHSHPRSAAIPSAEDVASAHYPNTAYVIVSLRGETAEIAAWRIESQGQRVYPVSLHMGVLPPERSALETEPLSPAQKTAIILSAVLAVLLVLLLSLSLLPPAPIIPS